MSSTTICATFAFAMPMNESGPVWSVMTPTLIGLGVIAASKLGHLRLALVPGLLQDRRHVGVRDEALPALCIPVEHHPDAALVVGVAEDGRALGSVLAPLVGTLGREDLLEALEVLDGGGCQEHVSLLCDPAPPIDTGVEAPLSAPGARVASGECPMRC